MSTQGLATRKNYWSLDVAKFFCAILIISSHFASEWGKFPTLIDYVFSLYVIAVPFFFCCSGFLFFKKLNLLPTKEDKKKYFIKYEKRIWIMYGLWTVVYFIHVAYDWIIDGEFGLKSILTYLHRCIVFSSYSTIWFLPALAVGVAITYFLVMKLNKKQITVIAVLLYIFSMFGYTYNFVVDGTPIGSFYDIYDMLFVSSRNGVFIVPFTYFFIMTVMHVELKENKVWLWCRKLSLLIFVSQRIFLSMLPAFFPTVFAFIYANSYIGLVAVIGMTVVFSVILVALSKKVKIIKMMI